MLHEALRGKTCMVTGASNGIGKAAAVELARAGAKLILVCRDRERGEAAIREIEAQSGNADLELMLADLSSQDQIRKLARDFLAREQPLHVLLNNAGVVNLRRTETVDGIETTFAVNHLAYFLLTVLLLDRIKASAPARIVNVASDAYRFVKGGLPWDDLGNRTGYGPMRAYGQSKLANILFTGELARRLEGSGVTANSVHPGMVGTGLAKNNGLLATLLLFWLKPFSRSPEKGARTSVYLCLSPEVEGVTGRYFADQREQEPLAVALDAGAARRLWEVSEKLTGV